MLKHLFLTFTLPLCAFSVHAQSVTGSIVDSLRSKVPYCAVALVTAHDSAIVKGTITDADGHFEFADVKKGGYRIMATSAGFMNSYSEAFTVDSAITKKIAPVVLRSPAVLLKEVEVNTIQNPVEFKGGNVIVNIENSPLAVGNSAYELLGKLPGVMVDNEDISVQGQGGVRVYLDDRLQQMTGAQLISFLKGLNSSQISKIEVIINPPAKYDAAGSGAIINIITKKAKITGLSGQVNYTFSKGYFSTHVGGFSLNYKGNKVNLFSSLNFYEGLVKNETNYRRRFASDSGVVELNDHLEEFAQAKHLNINLGGDWFIDDRNTIGIKLQAMPGESNELSPGTTDNSRPGTGFSRLRTERNNYNWWFYGNYNFNYEHLFDTSGTKLKFSTDYYHPYVDFYEAAFETHYLDGTGADLLPADNFLNKNLIGIKIISSKADFERKAGKTGEVSGGVKASYQDIYSDYRLERRSQAGDFTTDSDFTNIFNYREVITAAYANYESSFRKMNYNLGLRAENTDVQTNSISSSIRYTRKYLQVFPVFSINYNSSPSHIFSFSGNTRVHRPNYNSFNPYRWFSSILVSGEGNPFLLPEYTYNLNFNYVYKGKISNTLMYSFATNPFLHYPDQNDSAKTTIFKIRNVENLNHYRYVFNVRENLTKWWTSGINIGVYYINLTGRLDGTSFFNSALPWWIWSNQQFILPHHFRIEVMAFYWSPWLGGIGRMEQRWGVDLAFKKSFFDKKLNFNLSFNDIFFTKQWTRTVKFRNQDSYSVEAQDTRRVNIGISYNFGKVKVSQRQVEATDEEKGRIGK